MESNNDDVNTYPITILNIIYFTYNDSAALLQISRKYNKKHTTNVTEKQEDKNRR